MTLPKPIALRISVSAAVLWVGLRLMFAAIQASALLSGSPSIEATSFRTLVLLSPPAMLAFPGLVVAATFLDVRVTGEAVLYANLAIRPAHITMVVLIVSFALEGATILLFGVVGAPG